MKINVDNWHYKLMNGPRGLWRYRLYMATHSYEYMGIRRRPLSLCQYFWMLMANLWFIAGVYAFFITLVAVLGFYMLAFFVAFPSALILILVLSGIILFGAKFGPMIGVWIYNFQLERQRRRDAKRQQVRAPRAPGLLMSYLRAHKEKVCPIIEFE